MTLLYAATALFGIMAGLRFRPAGLALFAGLALVVGAPVFVAVHGLWTGALALVGTMLALNAGLGLGLALRAIVRQTGSRSTPQAVPEVAGSESARVLTP
ncbi:hypothetical protein [Chthonobacter rhizosphaerae]|uniref:hypothetical protein n=1 Tax=Chthonobacter rhizosphaerae TaxID=2735553 RepID=UPI0015EEE400|nr:hypothetical protein [Chthonobacter rhizosphaerae]